MRGYWSKTLQGGKAKAKGRLREKNCSSTLVLPALTTISVNPVHNAQVKGEQHLPKHMG
jgi:hypothetical protein